MIEVRLQRESAPPARSSRDEIRVYQGRLLLGSSPILSVHWAANRATATFKVDVEVEVSGRPDRVEVDLEGRLAYGFFTYLSAYDADVGDVLRADATVVFDDGPAVGS